MTLEISEEIRKQYPKLRIGAVVAAGVNNHGRSAELDSLARTRASEFSARYSRKQVEKHRNVVAWRNTYRSFGVDLGARPPTFQSYCMATLKSGEPGHWFSKAVNAHLLSELEYFLPVGGYDLDSVDGAIHLRYSGGGEEFVPVNAKPDSQPEKTRPGEIIYSDSKKVLTRDWNCKDSATAGITEASTRIALFAEAADESIPLTDDVTGIVERIKEYLVRFCGASAKTFLIEAEKESHWDLDLQR